MPELRPVVAAVRALMSECAPQAREVISYGMLVYKQNRIFAWISPTPKDITFAFSRGAQMEDRYRLLRGVAKHSRHVKMKNMGELKKTALRYYIKQALKLDQS